jgi:hypothetical protein
MHRCVEISNLNSVSLLDDGIIIVDILKNMLNKGFFNKLSMRSNKPSLISFIKDLIYLLLGSNGKKHYNFEVFSSFLNSDDSKTIKITNNHYAFLRANSSKKVVNEVYYIGTKYSEAGYFDVDVELEFLSIVSKDLIRRYPNKKIIYVVHRDDSMSKIAHIESLGFEIKKLHKPIELFFNESDFLPYSIAGAFSSAIINIAMIYGLKKIIFFKLPVNKITNKYKEHVNEIYHFYEERGFVVIDLYSLKGY